MEKGNTASEKMFWVIDALTAKANRVKNYNDKSYDELCDLVDEVIEKTNALHFQVGLRKIQFIKQKLNQFRYGKISKSTKDEVFNEELGDLKSWLSAQKSHWVEQIANEKQ